MTDRGTFNINVGVLGHVDSGKTSLAKALSTLSSTAAFDKNPQSQERGITLDLGFSAFTVDAAPFAHLTSHGIGALQVTLVDCPGHGSLIRTIIGGAQIIDIMMLVIDVTKGIQTQTAECIVIGEVLGRRLVVVLNKVDMLRGETEAEKRASLDKARRQLVGVFANTRWPSVEFVEVSAAPGGAGGAPPIGVEKVGAAIARLVDGAALRAHSEALNGADASKRFLMYVDHCFPIKGQGTVLTGTIIGGAISVGDEVHLPDYQLTRRVKGIQMFRKPVQRATVGDRVGMCVTQFDAKEMERGVVCGVRAGVLSITTAVIDVHRIRFHKQAIEAGAKFHISVGHSTVMGSMRFFSVDAGALASGVAAPFDFGVEYEHLDELPIEAELTFAPLPDGAIAGEAAEPAALRTRYFAVLLLESPVTTVMGATIIASRLDGDFHVNQCRLAVVGTLVAQIDRASAAVAVAAASRPDNVTSTSHVLNPSLAVSSHLADARQALLEGSSGEQLWRLLNVVKYKRKPLAIERVLDATSCVCKWVSDEDAPADASKYAGMSAFLEAPASQPAPLSPPPQRKAAIVGQVDGPFGKGGSRVKIRFRDAVFRAYCDAQAAARELRALQQQQQQQQQLQPEQQSPSDGANVSDDALEEADGTKSDNSRDKKSKKDKHSKKEKKDKKKDKRRADSADPAQAADGTGTAALDDDHDDDDDGREGKKEKHSKKSKKDKKDKRALAEGAGGGEGEAAPPREGAAATDTEERHVDPTVADSADPTREKKEKKDKRDKRDKKEKKASEEATSAGSPVDAEDADATKEKKEKKDKRDKRDKKEKKAAESEAAEAVDAVADAERERKDKKEKKEKKEKTARLEEAAVQGVPSAIPDAAAPAAATTAAPAVASPVPRGAVSLKSLGVLYMVFKKYPLLSHGRVRGGAAH